METKVRPGYERAEGTLPAWLRSGWQSQLLPVQHTAMPALPWAVPLLHVDRTVGNCLGQLLAAALGTSGGEASKPKEAPPVFWGRTWVRL